MFFLIRRRLDGVGGRSDRRQNREAVVANCGGRSSSVRALSEGFGSEKIEGRMMKRYLLFGALALVGCGDDGEAGPAGVADAPGPSGGANTFEVLTDGATEPFSEVGVRFTTTTSTIVTLTMIGGVDPSFEVTDDEYFFSLSLRFERDTLLALDTPTTLTVDGTATYTFDRLSTLDFSYSGEPDVLYSAEFERLCLCVIQAGTFQQTFQGTIQFDVIDSNEIRGSLSLIVDGVAVRGGGPARYELTGTFNREVPPGS